MATGELERLFLLAFNTSLSLPGNNSSSPSHSPPRSGDWFRTAMEYANIYLTPVIIVVGVCGNIMSFAVFTSTYVRLKSSSAYLALLATADAGFLVCLFFVWLARVRVTLFHSAIWCQLFVYHNYVFCFLSAWSVVGFTGERYVVVYHPLKKDGFCTRKRPKLSVLILVVLAALVYTFAFWTNDVDEIQGRSMCMPLPQYYDILTVITAIDMLITFMIPSVLIVVLNIRIIMKLRHFQQQSVLKLKRMRGQPITDPMAKKTRRPYISATVSHTGSIHYTFVSRSALAAPGDISPSQSSSTQTNVATVSRNISQYRTARILLVVSSIFLILNSPNHIFRLQAFLHNIIANQSKGSLKIIAWQELFQLTYFLNFAVNFFIYSLCSKTFRSALKRLCRRVCHRLRYQSSRLIPLWIKCTMRGRAEARAVDFGIPLEGV